MPFEIRVMPNTGHHYFFVPFNKEFIGKHGGLNGKLAKQCRSNNCAWEAVPRPEPKQKKAATQAQPQAAMPLPEPLPLPQPQAMPAATSTPQQAAEPAPTPTRSYEEMYYTWMRYRFGSKGGTNNLGVWVAVETNLGAVERGTVHDIHEITEQEMPTDGRAMAVSPYAYPSRRAISHDRRQPGEAADALTVLLSIKVDNTVIPIEPIEIIWQQANPDVIDVDLIVDFGNTRTVVLGMEDNVEAVQGGTLGSICKNIRFLPRGQEYPDLEATPAEAKFEDMGETIADSWFLVQQPMFAEWDYPSVDGEPTPFRTSKQYTRQIETTTQTNMLGFSQEVKTTRYFCTERVPQMFVEISPALMGQEARKLMNNVDLTTGINVTMSSPKRYLWDREQYGLKGGQSAWNFNYNSWSAKKTRAALPKLNGQICRYMYMDGSDWDITRPPYADPDPDKRPSAVPADALYPRSSAMVWSALTIIEAAYRQITSYNWRRLNRQYSTRRLRSVNVTFPSGWIAKEREYYRQAWKQAVDIFTLSHMNTISPITRPISPHEDARDVQGRPALNVSLDEAVASQLPFVYSEIRRLTANTWIELYGRNEQPGNYRTGKVRVMTVDIGGGTLDTSIIQYINDSETNVNLLYEVLFRDSNTFAGDSVTQAIIEQVLLPSFLNARGFDPSSDDPVVNRFKKVLMRARNSSTEKAEWLRIVSQLFLPIVRQWLSDVATCPDGIYRNENGDLYRLTSDCNINEQAITDLNKYLAGRTGTQTDTAFIKPDDRLMYNPEDINRCVVEVLSLGIEPLAKFVAAYEVDVVTLSGKISEMPKVVELLREYLPIRPQRIVRMKDFLAGDWYPMTDNDRINDAKTVTAVGAALYTAGRNRMLPDWTINESRDHTRKNTPNYWGIMPHDNRTNGFRKGGILLTPQENTNEDKEFTSRIGEKFNGKEVMINTYIGRQKYLAQNTMPERIYKLRWLGAQEESPQCPLAIVVSRKTSACGYDEDDPYACDEDDIELVSVTPTGPCPNFDPSKVELQLRTLSDDGFWMDECRFYMN